MSRLVIISSFAPRRDGIARYADQLVTSQRGSRKVLCIGIPGSAADRVFRLDGALRPLRICHTTRHKDEVVLMWHPEFYISGRFWGRILAYLALGVVFRLRNVTVIFHEPDVLRRAKPGALRRIARWAEYAAQSWCWASPAVHKFHSEHERRYFEAQFPRSTRTRRLCVITHGAHFRRYADCSKQDARSWLGISQDRQVLVCIGFVGRHKGFDRAIRAVDRLPAGTATLYVVGSPLYPSDEIATYLRELRVLAAGVPSVTLVEGFVDDVEFDMWLRAADALVAPYLSAASSSVVARAKLLGTTVVATPVGAIPEQLTSDDMIVNSDDELAEAMLRLVERGRTEQKRTVPAVGSNWGTMQ